MSDDLVRQLKERLRLEEVVGSTYKLRRDGRGWCAEAHDSLKVDEVAQLWTWFSQAAEPGQKNLGGDVLGWLSYQRFGRVRVPREQFIDVLKEACGLAGIPFPEKKDDASIQRAAKRRAVEEALGAYHALSVKLMDGATRVAIAERKPWLTAEVCARWQLGRAPTLSELKRAGLKLKALERVGLLRAKRYGKAPSPSFPLPEGEGSTAPAGEVAEAPAVEDWSSFYPFLKDRLVIPFFDSGRCVYVSNRALRDRTEEGHEIKKVLYLPSPSKPGAPGVEQPDGFNVDVLRDPRARELGVLLVEGALDAIACVERGFPAIAILRSSVAPGLVRRIRASGVAPYLALDGTADVTPLKAAGAAAAVGWSCRVCVLPSGKDPDDLSAEELAAVRAGAKPCLSAYLEALAAFRARVDALELHRMELRRFAAWVARWVVDEPGAAGEIRQACCAALGFSAAEYDAWVGAERGSVKAAEAARVVAADEPATDERPAALGWVDETLEPWVQRASKLESGAKRDRETVHLFEELSRKWGALPSVSRDRVRELVCGALGLGKRAFDRQLKESFNRSAQYQNEHDGTDWPALARAFLADWEPDRAVRRWREDWFVWERALGCYRPWSTERMRATVNQWLVSRDVPLTQTASSNFLNALLTFTHLKEEQAPPSWLVERAGGIYVALKNGILNLLAPDEPLHAHSSEFWSLCCLPFEYEPGAACPDFLRALARWQPLREITKEQYDRTPEDARVQQVEDDGVARFYSQENRLILQEFAGYLYEPGNPRQKFMMNIGEGNDGKSVFVAVLIALVGAENMASQGLEAFDPRNQFGLEPLLGKMLNVVGDANDLDRVGEGTLKQIVGGDSISINRKNRSVITEKLAVKFVMNANQLPPFRDRSEGIWRRLLLVKWEHPMQRHEVVEHFAEDLVKREIAGIFNWALDGFRRAHHRGFTSGAISEQVVGDARRQVHKEQSFFDERLEVCLVDQGDRKGLLDEEVSSTGEAIVAAYKDWANAFNMKKGLYGDNMLTEMRRWVKKHWPIAYDDVENRSDPQKRFRRREASGNRKYFYVGIRVRHEVVQTQDAFTESWRGAAS